MAQNLRISVPSDTNKIPLHKESENPIPICTKPITNQEYLEFIDSIRNEPEFDRLPLAPCAYEHFPEFAETKEQVAGINAEWTDAVIKANKIGDLEAEKNALERRVKRLKKMAKKNKAIKTAKKRILDILAEQEELKLKDTDEEILSNTA